MNPPSVVKQYVSRNRAEKTTDCNCQSGCFSSHIAPPPQTPQPSCITTTTQSKHNSFSSTPLLEKHINRKCMTATTTPTARIETTTTTRADLFNDLHCTAKECIGTSLLPWVQQRFVLDDRNECCSECSEYAASHFFTSDPMHQNMPKDHTHHPPTTPLCEAECSLGHTCEATKNVEPAKESEEKVTKAKSTRRPVKVDVSVRLVPRNKPKIKQNPTIQDDRDFGGDGGDDAGDQ